MYLNAEDVQFSEPRLTDGCSLGPSGGGITVVGGRPTQAEPPCSMAHCLPIWHRARWLCACTLCPAWQCTLMCILLQ
jgi:hypothetical protein